MFVFIILMFLIIWQGIKDTHPNYVKIQTPEYMTKHLDVDTAQKLIQLQICISLSPYVNKNKNKHLKIIILRC